MPPSWAEGLSRVPHVILGLFQVDLVVGNCGPTNKGSHFREIQNEPFIFIISLNACKNLEE